MAQEGPFSFGSAAHDPDEDKWGGLPEWSNPGNLAADDGSHATIALGPETTARPLMLTARGGEAVPAGSTITGFSGTVRGFASSADVIRLTYGPTNLPLVYLVLGGASDTNRTPESIGPVASGTLGTSESEFTFPAGGPSLWGGAAPSVAQVNATDFGLIITVRNAQTGIGLPTTASLDHVTMTIHFTPPAKSASRLLLMGCGSLLAPLFAWLGLPYIAAWLRGERSINRILHPA